MKKFKFIFLNVLTYVLLFVFFFPIFWLVLSSFRPAYDLYAYPPKLFTTDLTFENYVNAWTSGDFPIYFLNSAIVTISATILTVAISMMAGFALAKYKFFGGNAIFWTILATLMLPLQVIMVPIFIVLKDFHMLNSYLGLIIPPAATPTGIFLVRQYLVSLPNELIEFARIDGASEWRIFWSIILPLSTPVIATLSIFSVLWRWNDFLWPLIVISNEKLYTVQLALGMFSGQHTINWSGLLPMTVLSMIPIVIVFIAFQRLFIKGIYAGSVK
jgi:alpha-1,4-digalacturonate transport system permease protein